MALQLASQGFGRGARRQSQRLVGQPVHPGAHLVSIFDTAIAALALVGCAAIAIGILIWREYRAFVNERTP